LLVFSVAVSEKLMVDQAEAQGRQALRQLLSRLDLSNEDVAGMLGVSADTVQKWESARSAIPVQMRARLSRANSALNRMLAIFRPERLPHVVRQDVELFKGQSAHDWIVQGRIQEVAELYETAFAYQG
jgi:transcriptional regulator with XRE-family HTH domain